MRSRNFLQRRNRSVPVVRAYNRGSPKRLVGDAHMGQAGSVTRLLLAWNRGNLTALEQLVPRVASELRRMARRHMTREASHHTLQPTALINEVYLRLIDGRRVAWQDRAHFFAMAARLMRRILVDYARARHNAKRGGAFRRVPLTEALAGAAADDQSLLALDDALKTLAEFDPRRSQVVELRFFGGLTVDETAAVLRVSPQTVMRDWQLARAWLRREAARGERDDA